MKENTIEGEVFDFLISKPGYLKNLKRVAKRFQVDVEHVREVAKGVRKELKARREEENKSVPVGMVIKSMWDGPGGETKYSYEKAKGSAVDQEDLRKQVKEALEETIKPWKLPKKSVTNKKGLFLFTSDKHVGAETKEQSMYKNPYDAKIFEARMEKVLEEAYAQYRMHGRFDTVALMDLGDPLDGFGGYTTRGGHGLPQNMTDREQFDAYVKVHRKFFDSLVKMGITNNIKFVAVTNDNHSGSFGYCANRAVDIYLEVKYPEIDRMVIDKFMDHFEYGNHTYIVSHGKDEEDMRTGLPFKLTPVAENYINDYINIKEIRSKQIHFIKGDLHQSACEYGKRFRYKNCMSLYGSSKWIHTNYGSGKAGVDFEVVEKYGTRISQDRILF